jgi:hypothetical protein
MKQKRYWLRGMLIGILLGILVTWLHQHLYQIADFLGADFNKITSSSSGTVSYTDPWFSWLISRPVGYLYILAELPWFFVGMFILVLQYYAPPITYGLLGLILGRIYGKIKNKKLAPSA